MKGESDPLRRVTDARDVLAPEPLVPSDVEIAEDGREAFHPPQRRRFSVRAVQMHEFRQTAER